MDSKIAVEGKTHFLAFPTVRSNFRHYPIITRKIICQNDRQFEKNWKYWSAQNEKNEAFCCSELKFQWDYQKGWNNIFSLMSSSEKQILIEIFYLVLTLFILWYEENQLINLLMSDNSFFPKLANSNLNFL